MMKLTSTLIWLASPLTLQKFWKSLLWRQQKCRLGEDVIQMQIIVCLYDVIENGAWLPIRKSCHRVLPRTLYVVHCWLINPNKLFLLSWLLTYLCDNKVHGTYIVEKNAILNNLLCTLSLYFIGHLQSLLIIPFHL